MGFAMPIQSTAVQCVAELLLHILLHQVVERLLRRTQRVALKLRQRRVGQVERFRAASARGSS